MQIVFLNRPLLQGKETKNHFTIFTILAIIMPTMFDVKKFDMNLINVKKKHEKSFKLVPISLQYENMRCMPINFSGNEHSFKMSSHTMEFTLW
jgi:hypothetical protein